MIKKHKMSNKLKWCLGFSKAVDLRRHPRWRTRKKNIHRVQKMMRKAFRRWGCFPLPPEWKQNSTTRWE